MRVARSSGLHLGGAPAHGLRVLRPAPRGPGRAPRRGTACPRRGVVVHADHVLEVRRLAADLGDLPRLRRRSRRRSPWPRCRSGCRAPGARRQGRVDGRRPPRPRRGWPGRRMAHSGRFSERIATRSPFSTPSARRPIDSSSTARRNSSGADAVPGAVLACTEVLGLPVGVDRVVEELAEGADRMPSPASPRRGHGPRAAARRAALRGDRRRAGTGPPTGPASWARS